MLVLDTDKLKEFCRTLEVLGPEHSKNMLRFIQEVLENTLAFERKVKRKEREVECLMKSLDEMQETEDEGKRSLWESDRGTGGEACNS